MIPDRLAPRTITEYRRRWVAFEVWCVLQARQAMPATPSTVASFLLDVGEKLSLSALALHRAGIAWMHGRHNVFPSPTDHPVVSAAVRSLRRRKGVRAWHAKSPLTLSEMKQLVARVDRTTLAGNRDAALLLAGFWGGFRRSELCGIDREQSATSRAAPACSSKVTASSG